MVSLSDFSEWMKENTELSDSSIYKYMRAVNTTPTRVHQRLSQNNLRKRQISCETTADLAK